MLGRYCADEVRRALRDVQRATGALRDEEVLLELVGSLGVTHPDVQRWTATRRRREQRLRRALVAAVDAGELERGRRLLQALLAFPIKRSRDRRVAKFARRAVEAARREVDRRRDARADDADALHRLRIAYKRLRYVVDTFSDALPAELAAIAQAAARFQGRLGELHDADVALACIRRARSLSPEARVELLAALDSVRAARLGAYVRERDSGALAVAGRHHAVGTDSLRKISTR